MQNYMPFGIEFNPDVIKKMKEIDSKIEKEKEAGSLDAESETKLKMEKLLRGMQLNTGFNYKNNFRAMFPY